MANLTSSPKPKANATLAAELKRLGFRRSVGWNKSRFTKMIWDEDGENAIEIKASIANFTFLAVGWFVDRVEVTTERRKHGSSTFELAKGTIVMSSSMAVELASTLEALSNLEVKI